MEKKILSSDEILKMSFDEAMSKLEENLDILEKSDEKNDNSDLFEESIKLKEYCEKLLKQEREDIERIAKENNIDLNELNLDDDKEEN